jgi:cell division protein FtsL
MSVATSILPFGIGCLGTWAFGVYQQHQKQQEYQQQLNESQQQRLELEEEIVRLKREMRICGIKTSSEMSE